MSFPSSGSNAPRSYVQDVGAQRALLFVALLLCADLAFIALHSAYDLTSLVNNPLYSLGEDSGYSEMYQYIKWFWVTLLLGYVSVSKRSFHYISWALVFAYFLFDDALSIHEDVGERVAETFALTSLLGIRPRDFGELAVSLAAGVLLLSFIAWAYARGSQTFKKRSQDLLLLILALVFFGVVVDMAEIAIEAGQALKFILKVVEDGGEMVVASLMLWYVFMLSAGGESSTPYLSDRVRAVSGRASSWFRR